MSFILYRKGGACLGLMILWLRELYTILHRKGRGSLPKGVDGSTLERDGVLGGVDRIDIPGCLKQYIHIYYCLSAV